MKKILLAIAFVAIGVVSCKKEKKNEVKTEAPVEVKHKVIKEGNVNVATSVVEWIGSKPAESHNGTIKLSLGTLNVEEGKIKGGEFVIDMNSIANLDVEGKYKTKLENHLKGTDFFDVAKFPTAKFVIADVKQDGEKVDVTGNLTIKDKTKSITFPATFKTTETGYVLESESFKINRLDFGVTYKSKTITASLKDKFINDLIEFKVKLNVKK